MDKEIKAEGLTDEELDSAAGGSGKDNNCSCSSCGYEFYNPIVDKYPCGMGPKYIYCPRCKSSNICTRA